MTAEFCSRGTRIEEEDFCHRTENDVEFKCLEGLNAKLQKFYSWNKAIMVQIEIDGTIFCGCLYQDNNSFAPVKFGPPKRPPLPCIMPSKPKSPKRKKNAETSSSKAYSRENFPRIYIDPRNTVQQRFRPRRDKSPSNNQWNTPSQIGKEKSHRRANELGVLVYSDRKMSRCDQNSKNSTENNSCLHRSKRLCNSFDELKRIDVVNGFKTGSNDKFPAFRSGHASPKNNEDVVKSIGHKGKRRGAPRKTSISYKPNLRPRRAKYGSVQESVNCGSDSYEALSSQCLVIDLTVDETDFDEIFHPTDIIGKSIEISETSAHQMSHHHSLMNSENKEGHKITAFDSDSQALNADKTLKSINNVSREVNGLPKSRSKRKRAVTKECSDLSDKFEEMTI